MAVKTAPYDPVRHLTSPWAQAELRPDAMQAIPARPMSTAPKASAFPPYRSQAQTSRASVRRSTRQCSDGASALMMSVAAFSNSRAHANRAAFVAAAAYCRALALGHRADRVQME